MLAEEFKELKATYQDAEIVEDKVNFNQLSYIFSLSLPLGIIGESESLFSDSY